MTDNLLQFTRRAGRISDARLLAETDAEIDPARLLVLTLELDRRTSP